MSAGEDKERFTIRVAAELLSVHQQTLRLYEREGLVSPQRTPGNTRMYSRRDIERLQTILNLTREMGVNLAGVQVILNLLDRMEDQQGRMEEMKEFIRQEMWTLLKEKYGETSTALTPVDHQGVVPFRRKRP
ncbi:MAG: helix-turn-helix transcriptional regulator [Nitrospinota bacterium]|jgi:MerR family transcriptional regulator/heat shock protein HspR|nr:helix-turn-helix transcriptional regulator [Nitrospinota bacterium]MDP7387181.1 helix-turn-helix transcriptional regulator [Nitrospinota bacterium]HJM43997.1 helix-turn-helix transcriptional regulator [Nitrospinota bacterium]